MHKEKKVNRKVPRIVWVILIIGIVFFLGNWTVKGLGYDIEAWKAPKPNKTFTTENQEYVYCSASAPIYVERDDSQSIGMLIDVVNYFTNTSVAELVDNSGFPFPVPYEAYAHEENRYQIEYGGNTYWIDPYPSLPATDSNPLT